MKTMVVAGWEINNQVLKLVASIFNSFEQSLYTTVITTYFIDSASAILITVVSNHSHHEFVQTVWTSFDAVNGAISAVNSAWSQNGAIAGGT